MVQWLRLRSSAAGGTGWIPGQAPKIPHATQPEKKTKKKPSCSSKKPGANGPSQNIQPHFLLPGILLLLVWQMESHTWSGSLSRDHQVAVECHQLHTRCLYPVNKNDHPVKIARPLPHRFLCWSSKSSQLRSPPLWDTMSCRRWKFLFSSLKIFLKTFLPPLQKSNTVQA